MKYIFFVIIFNIKFIVKVELYKSSSEVNFGEIGRKLKEMPQIQNLNHVKNTELNLNKRLFKDFDITKKENIDKKFKSFHHHSDDLSNDNYEEANVSVILNSEAGPIAINGFKGELFRYKSLATTKKPQDYGSDYVYDDSPDPYEEPQQTSYNENTAMPTKNFENVQSLLRIYDTFNNLWNLYYNFKENPIIKRETIKNVTEVVEGRYIKGDPLKGYYDFVITEGSYKFWAAFQLATAVLIIYSTFAAIYYSKVNPLVGDYDYVDYLGGGRTFSDDADFNDISPDKDLLISSGYFFKDGNYVSSLISNSIQNWLPKWKYSLIFVLNAIDKLPSRD